MGLVLLLVSSPSLIHSANVLMMELSLPPACAIHATVAISKPAAARFDFLADLLTSHSSLYSSAEWIAVFRHIIPLLLIVLLQCYYYSILEADGICLTLCSALFLVDNLTPPWLS